jgi:Phasin protein
MRIQAEFMQSQFTAMGEQSKHLGEAYTRTASDAMNKAPKF